MEQNRNENKSQEKKEIKKVAKKKAKKQIEKVFGGHTGQLKNHLLMKSSYLQSLLDPLNQTGARVPDDITQASLTAHCLQRIQLTTTVDGLVGVSYLVGCLSSSGSPNSADITTTSGYSPAPSESKSKGPAFPPTPKQEIRSSSISRNSSEIDVKAEPAVKVGAAPFINWTGAQAKAYASGLRNVSSQGRVVSAALYGFYEGTPLSMSGRAIAQAWSRVEALSGSVDQQPPSIVNPAVISSPPTTADIALTQRVCSDRPLQATRGQSSVRWVPCDDGDRLYTNLNVPDANYDPCEVGRLTMIMDGLPSGAVVEFWVVENWELLPLNQIVNFAQPTPSLHDPLELALASNVISENPNIQVAPARVTQTMRSGKVDAMHNGPVKLEPTPSTEQGGVMDSIFKFVERAIPIGEKLLPLAGPLLGLL